MLCMILWVPNIFAINNFWLNQSTENKVDRFLISVDTTDKIQNLINRINEIDLLTYDYSVSTVTFLEKVFAYILSELDQKNKLLIEKIQQETLQKQQQEEEILQEQEQKRLETIQNTQQQVDISEFFGDSYVIVGWESARVYTADVSANLEKIDVWEVNFVLRGTGDISNVRQSIKNASLYYGNTFISRNSNSDIDIESGIRFSISFPNIDNLIVGLDEEDLHLVLHTEQIGFQKIGLPLDDFFVESLEFSDSKGVTSWNDSPSFTLRDDGDIFSIASGNIIPTVKRTLNFGVRAELELFFNTLNNVSVSSNSRSPAVLDRLIFDIGGSNFGDNSVVFTLENSDTGSSIVGSIVGNSLIFDASQLPASSRIIAGNTSEDFEIVVWWINSSLTIFLDLESRWIEYTVDGRSESISLFRDLSLWNYSAR